MILTRLTVVVGVAIVVSAAVGAATVLAGRRRESPDVEHRAARRAAVLSGAVTLAVGAVVVWIHRGVQVGTGLASRDIPVATWASEHTTDGLTSAMSWVTDLGSTLLVYAAVAIVAILAHRRTGEPRVVWYLATVTIGVTLVNNGLKLIFDRERPNILQLVEHAGSSFPSGHSATAAAGWAAIALVVGRGRSAPTWAVATGVAVLIALFVAATRVLLGVHWLTDVAAGLLVGWWWCAVVSIAYWSDVRAANDELLLHRADDRAATPEAVSPN